MRSKQLLELIAKRLDAIERNVDRIELATLVREPGNLSPVALVFRALSAAAARRITTRAADRVYGLRDTGRMTGEVGRKVAQMLQDAGETTVVIDAKAQAGVNVVGNVLEQSTLDRARVRDAKAVVMALGNDSAGIFATAVLRDYAPELPLIARVNRGPNVGRLYEAGADFAISVGQVAGQILAYHLLEQASTMVEQHLKFARMTSGTLMGDHPWRAGIGKKTGAAVIAIERGAEVFTEFDDAFRILSGDVLFICGTASSIDKYTKAYAATIARAKVA